MSAPSPIPENSSGQKVSPAVIALLMNVQKGALDPSTLTDDQRRACVCHLTHEGTMTVYEMSLFFKVSARTIIRDRKKNREGNELRALLIDEADLAMDMIEECEVACARLKKSGKWKEAMEIRFKLIEKLQDMGYVKKIAQDLNVKGSLNLLQVLNLELQLREKESPDTGDENAADTNGNGHSGAGLESSPRLEDVPE